MAQTRNAISLRFLRMTEMLNLNETMTYTAVFAGRCLYVRHLRLQYHTW